MSIRRALFITSFGLFVHTQCCAQELQVDVSAVKALISEWNAAHSLSKLESLASVYSDTVNFYGRSLHRRACLSITKAALEKDVDFAQTLKNELVLSGYSSGVIRCDFVKTVSYNGLVVDYPSYLVVKESGGGYLIVGESDLVTDRNLNHEPNLGSKIAIRNIAGALAIDEAGQEADSFQTDSATLTEILVGVSFAVGVIGLLVAWGIRRKSKTSQKSQQMTRGVLTSQDFEEGLALLQKTRNNSSPKGSEYAAIRSEQVSRDSRQISKGESTPERGGELPSLAGPKPAAFKGLVPAEDSQFSVFLAKGRAFEEYIVHQFALNKSFFTLLDWRSDKFYRGVYPKSSQNPDLVYQFKAGDFVRKFSVECKYRSNSSNSIIRLMDERKFTIYEAFNRNEMRVYIALGIGGKPDSPTELYLIPFEHVKPEMQHRELTKYKSPGMFFYNRDMDQLT
jgi:hypothetical protein